MAKYKAVASMNVKGGTGKTLTAINIAYYLKQKGYKVALIDCDIDNSNFVFFTKAEGKIEVEGVDKFKPYDWNGIQVFSMSLLVDRDRSISMTGDRYAQIIADVVNDSMWNAEYFVLDLPGGADDIFRTIIRLFADSYVGSVIVTLPGLEDALKRSLNLHKYFDIPVVGVIENMAYFECPHCHSRYHIFGDNLAEKICKDYGVTYLGAIPLSPTLNERIKKGNPILTRTEAKPILKAVELAEKLEPRTPGLAERLKEKFTDKMKYYFEKALATLIISANRELNIGELQAKYGFTYGLPLLLTVTDESGENIVTNACFRVADGKIKLVREPKQIAFQVVLSAKTLARILMGKAKTRSGRVVDYDPWDAWLNGDIKVYGKGHAPRVIAVLQKLFGDKELTKQIREKYGKILEVFI